MDFTLVNHDNDKAIAFSAEFHDEMEVQISVSDMIYFGWELVGITCRFKNFSVKLVVSHGAISSVGRATALQAVGHKFEPCIAHHHTGVVVEIGYNTGLSRRRPRVRSPSTPPFPELQDFLIPRFP